MDGVEQVLRMLAKIRIRYKKLLYEALELDLKIDEVKGKVSIVELRGRIEGREDCYRAQLLFSLGIWKIVDVS